MPPFEVHHPDPHRLARTAAVRSAREQDASTREHSRTMTTEQRLRAGFELSRMASKLRPRTSS
jgi:hypothetical protein